MISTQSEWNENWRMKLRNWIFGYLGLLAEEWQLTTLLISCVCLLWRSCRWRWPEGAEWTAEAAASGDESLPGGWSGWSGWGGWGGWLSACPQQHRTHNKAVRNMMEVFRTKFRQRCGGNSGAARHGGITDTAGHFSTSFHLLKPMENHKDRLLPFPFLMSQFDCRWQTPCNEHHTIPPSFQHKFPSGSDETNNRRIYKSLPLPSLPSLPSPPSPPPPPPQPSLPKMMDYLFRLWPILRVLHSIHWLQLPLCNIFIGYSAMLFGC